LCLIELLLTVPASQHRQALPPLAFPAFLHHG
jgi:hypothetical protein